MTYVAIGFSLQFLSQTHPLRILATLLLYKRLSWLSGSLRKFVLINESNCTKKDSILQEIAVSIL